MSNGPSTKPPLFHHETDIRCRRRRSVTDTHCSLNHYKNPGDAIQKTKRGSKRPPETEESQDDTSVINNKSDFQAIASKCETIRDILESATKDATEDNLQGYFGHALSQLNKSVNHINSDVASKKEQGFWHRLLSVTIDCNWITGWEKTWIKPSCYSGVENLTLVPKDSTHEISDIQCRPPMPPSRPSMFYSREDLAAELTNLVIKEEHFALIGPGGMGKSSLVKASPNEPLIIAKFANRRFFMIYDGLDPSTISFETFKTCFIEALSIEIVGADPCPRQYRDNAEIFEEASASSALGGIPPAIAEVANIPSVTLVLTSRSRRNVPDVHWIMKDVPPLDLSSFQAVLFRIYHHASRSEAEEDIKGLLKELDIHPLSINILANAAQRNSCKVLDTAVAQLAINPGPREDDLRALAIIAFLPQGLNEDLASDLLPSLPQVDAICDVLCMLALIRHYVRDSLPEPDSTRLREIRTLYYRTVQWYSEERDGHADIIIWGHFNIEYVVAFDLAHLPKETYRTCSKILQYLQLHLPRPTTLTPVISSIMENSSTWTLKAHCLLALARLYHTLSQLAEAARAYQTAEALYLTAGNPESMGH
ncbi:hypothetical protein EDB19DRAFT_2027192 [Suillus lakei]|nr:hypothetical protein EDB19DRAFT_2027192 [Suillus lakei]